MKASSPHTLRVAQVLNDNLISLSDFISKSAKKKVMPLFQTLKGCIEKSYFQWTPTVEATSDT